MGFGLDTHWGRMYKLKDKIIDTDQSVAMMVVNYLLTLINGFMQH